MSHIACAMMSARAEERVDTWVSVTRQECDVKSRLSCGGLFWSLPYWYHCVIKSSLTHSANFMEQG